MADELVRTQLGGVFREPVFGTRVRYSPRRIGLVSAGEISGAQAGDHDVSAAAADSFSAQLLAQVAIANAAGASETVTAAKIAQAALADAAGAADAVAATLAALAAQAESLGISEAVAAALVSLASLAEQAAATDDLSALFGRFGHPVADESNSGWTSTEATLWQALAGERNDATYISATAAATCREVMTQHKDPGDTLHAIKIASPAGYAPAGTLTVTLYAGVDQIAQWVITDLAADEERQLDLSSAERDAISTYTDFDIVLEASA